MYCSRFSTHFFEQIFVTDDALSTPRLESMLSVCRECSSTQVLEATIRWNMWVTETIKKEVEFHGNFMGTSPTIQDLTNHKLGLI